MMYAGVVSTSLACCLANAGAVVVHVCSAEVTAAQLAPERFGREVSPHVRRFRILADDTFPRPLVHRNVQYLPLRVLAIWGCKRRVPLFFSELRYTSTDIEPLSRL